MNIKQITPHEAWAILKEDRNAILVDVRTSEELNFTGYADLSSITAKFVAIAWRFYPDMRLNKNFASELTENISQFSSDTPSQTTLLFLCRSGGRSQEAAAYMSNLGYKSCNILGGFEGEADQFGHRGNINGWKADNLPWRQN